MQLGEVGSRILIVDFNHLIHQYMNSKAPRLHAVREVSYMHGGETRSYKETIETTIPAYTCKSFNRWAEDGLFTLAVCFDSPCRFRKDYFSVKDGVKTNIEYKGDRKPMLQNMYEGAELTRELLVNSGVPVYKADGYEADDLVYSLVMICKELYPNIPIDIVCNDADLLPLVDEQVSVFFRSKKLTWAENKKLEKRGYWQVTPNNYEKVVGELSKYSKFCMPYNSILLHKLLRGDDSDGIPACIVPETGRPDFPPKMYNQLVELMHYDGVDIGNIFRYPNFKPSEEIEKVRKLRSQGHETVRIADFFSIAVEEKIKEINSVLSNYVDEHTLEHVAYTYRGMTTRYLNLIKPARYNPNKLRAEASKLQISIPVL